MGIQSTVVFTDLYESTAVFGVLGNARAAAVITTITSRIASLAASFGGRFIKILGDGVMVVFSDKAQAFEFVVEVQRASANGVHPWPQSDLPIKVGLAFGEIEELAGDCYGDAVNVAARLCDLCGPSQIWACETALAPNIELKGIGIRPLGPIFIRGRSAACHVFQIEWREDEPSDLMTLQAHRDVPATAGRDALGTEVRLRLGAQTAVFHAFDFPVHIGRAQTAALVVSDPRVSRTHAKLVWRQGRVLVVDLSTYGTWVRFSDDGQSDLLLRREECVLHGQGFLSLGVSFADMSAPNIQFEIH
jgi:adenylate cyclase